MPKKVTLTCRQIKLSLWIGFHPGETTKKQNLWIDFEAILKSTPAREDDPSSLTLDYFKAYHLIQDNLAGQKIKLIETVADKVAEILKKNFPIKSVTVHVTKKPFNLKGAEVTYSIQQ